MAAFAFDEKTPLIRIWEAYPWLSETLPALDRRFAVINTPMGKLLMKTNTVADLARMSGQSSEELLAWLRAEIEKK